MTDATMNVLSIAGLAVLGLVVGWSTAGRHRGRPRNTVAIGAGVTIFMAVFLVIAADPPGIGLAVAAAYGAGFAIAAYLSTRSMDRRDQELREALADMSITDEHGDAIDPASVRVMTPQMERQLARRGQLPPDPR